MIKLNHILNTEKFDLIRSISLVPGYIAAIVSKKYHIPTITNVSDFYSDLYKHSDLPFPLIASNILRKMEEVVVKNSDIFIVDSPIQRKYWKERGLNEKRGVVIPHGIYPDRFNSKENQGTVRKKYGISSTTKIIYYHGDISHQDGVDILIDSVPYIVRSEENVRFMIVGTGTEKYMTRLRRQIEKYKIQKFFIFTGWIPHFFIPQYITTADLCVAPFRLALTSNTSLSNKIIEYLAMRKPVVASRGEGTKEMIGDTIVYVDPENPQDLAEAIIKTLNHESMKSTPQIETIISRLNWIKILNREEEIISKINNIEDLDFRKYDYFLR